ncbi:glutaredoxin 3 [Vogesella indigofera]|jgi:glutaredoxin 3|uniref:glutaredoxin 3 n=1 Tax=Vogesella indigofera TaxID=45465 RepID=UPI00234DD86C|nr:glutaredoxin 3 [Vogesella indigofera]MDC7705835.1 glutaredoxin 3 [Vogesella indigofera]
MTDITMFHTSTCPYCVQAERLLSRKGITTINKVNIEQSVSLRDEMILRSGRRTVPQIFINGQHLGGFDDLARLEQSGELAPMLGLKA